MEIMVVLLSNFVYHVGRQISSKYVTEFLKLWQLFRVISTGVVVSPYLNVLRQGKGNYKWRSTFQILFLMHFRLATYNRRTRTDTACLFL